MYSEIFRYFISGIGSNTVNFLVYYLLYMVGIHIFISSFLGYLIGLFISYSLGRKWVFGKEFKSTTRRALSFIIVYIIGGLGMSTLILVSTNYYNFDYKISWIFGALFAVINNFFGQKFYVFKDGLKNGQ